MFWGGSEGSGKGGDKGGKGAGASEEEANKPVEAIVIPPDLPIEEIAKEVARLKEESWRSKEDHVSTLWMQAVEKNDRSWVMLLCFLLAVAIGLLTVVAYRLDAGAALTDALKAGRAAADAAAAAGRAAADAAAGAAAPGGVVDAADAESTEAVVTTAAALVEGAQAAQQVLVASAAGSSAAAGAAAASGLDGDLSGAAIGLPLMYVQIWLQLLAAHLPPSA